MKIHILNSKKKVSLYASAKIIHQIKHKKNSVLGLSTGNTMVPLYKDLVHSYKNNLVDFDEVKSFNVDEYVGIDKRNKNGFYNYMVRNLFNQTNFKKINVNFPTKNNYSNYDEMIIKSGGIDLMILGLGRNGHIAFNEPGLSSDIKSKTRLIELSPETIKINRLKNTNISKAYTIGISTILKSHNILILAFGKEKSNAVYNLIHGKINNNNPSSFLRTHKNVDLILDKDSAKLIHDG